MTTNARELDRAAGADAFDRVVAGIDVHDPRLDAARKAARLVNPDGWLELFCAVYLMEANLAGWSAARIRKELRHEAREALNRARQAAGPQATTRLVNGPVTRSLKHELTERRATLAVVGTRGESRLSEILIGGVAGELLHDAPCSVCIARPSRTLETFPRSIVVGVDGSPESGRAADVAGYLADRYGAPLTIVAATGGKKIDRRATDAVGAVAIDGHPVPALVAAADDADLLVVGSRGLHGFRALGSVSERVAHQATCSVLVVRRGD